MNTYTIYHPVNGALNTTCKPGVHMYDTVASVKAISLEMAFFLGQNDFNSKYAALNHRSTSVGDIIAVDDRYFIVSGIGFQEVNSTWVTYIDWGVIKDQLQDVLHQDLKRAVDRAGLLKLSYLSMYQTAYSTILVNSTR